MDRDQSPADSNQHAMATPKQAQNGDTEGAINGWQAFVAGKIDSASTEQNPDGTFTAQGLQDLGDAMHTLQDSTSPTHIVDGIPQPWYGVTLGHVEVDYEHVLGENSPSQSWAGIGKAIRLTMAAYVQTNPTQAAKHGLTPENLDERAQQRITAWIESYYNGMDDPVQEDMARQCALGNPAACE